MVEFKSHYFRTYDKSTAALQVAKELQFPWYFLYYTFIGLPSFVRDPLYNFVGKNRYKIFGKKEECWIPTPKLKSLFLDNYNFVEKIDEEI